MFKESVLVAIMNNERDFRLARDRRWYRVPVVTAPKRFPPDYLAFYFTKAFGNKKWAIYYFAKVLHSEIKKRIQLLPHEPHHLHAQWDYYKLSLSELQKLPRPIISRRWRRIIFIPTTLRKFLVAEEINDLFNESPLEDELWEAFKNNQIQGERQFEVGKETKVYRLDFAIFCQNRHLDVECDGDTWHGSPARIPLDNERDNFLTSQGWGVLRFSSQHIREELPGTILRIKDAINRYGGVNTDKGVPRFYEVENEDQLRFF